MFDNIVNKYTTNNNTTIEHKCNPAEWETIEEFNITKEVYLIGEVIKQKCKQCGIINVVKYEINK